MLEFSFPNIIKLLFKQKKSLIAAVILGAILGLIVAVFNTIAGAPASALIKLADNSALTNLNIPEVYQLQSEDIIEKLVVESIRYDNVVQAVAKYRQSNKKVQFSAKLSHLMLNSERIRFTVEPINADNAAKGVSTAFLQIYVEGTHPSIGVALIEELLIILQSEVFNKIEIDRRAAIIGEERNLMFFLESKRPQKLNLDKLLIELSGLQAELLARRQNQIIRLQEALAVAEATAVVEPAVRDVAISDSGLGAFDAIGDGSVPLFLFGSKALQKQLAILKSRKSDDHDDSRVVEIKRDIELLQRTGNENFIRIRGDTDVVGKEYALAATRLHALQAVSQEVSEEIEIIEVLDSPRISGNSDFTVFLFNIVRGIILALLVVFFWLSVGFMSKTINKFKD